MIHLDLQPEVEAQLAAEAHARGLSLDQYVESIVTDHPRSLRNRHVLLPGPEAE